ncbi:hypothetical protein SDC9_201140 [bioreactor metagenome]|uniref:DUF4116 domain-containing protein n=1 Tax=bioreactor metagenome TaxID=1076179 RepID=A0A645IQU7_9ZZZZ
MQRDWSVLKYIENPFLEVEKVAINKNEEAMRYITNLNEEKLRVFVVENIKIVKYIDEYNKKQLLDTIQFKLGEENVDNKYVIDFIECEALKFNGVKFIHKHGSKKAKQILVDYKLGT